MLAAGLHGIDPDAIDHKGKTALQIAHEREGTPDGFVELFESLLADFRARNTSLEDPAHGGEGPNEEFKWLHPRTWTRSSAKTLKRGRIIALIDDL